MRRAPSPRLVAVLRGLDDAARLLDGLRAEVVELLRDQGHTWEEIGEMFDPPISRQALQKWMTTRRRRRATGP